jgi:uncharacterized protein (TIGR03435 family)
VKELALLLALTAVVTAQEFDVASIRPAVEDHNATIDAENGRYLVHNIALKRLIALAWSVDGSEVIGGANWIASDHWDITAKIPDEYAMRSQDQCNAPRYFGPSGQMNCRQFLNRMIQNLLANRFRLAIHRETREVSGYALVVAKNGPKMAVAKPDEEASLPGGNQGGNMRLKATNVRMEVLAQVLSDGGRLVVDKTGLAGGYDFELHWALADDPTSDLPTIFTAVKEQLGLQLEPAKVPIQAVIIDRVEKPNEN